VWARRTGEAAETIDEMVARQVGWARDHGFVHRLELLAAHGLVADQPSWEAPPDIHLAATPGAVQAVAASGADVDARREGRTALHQAAFMDDVELVQALLDAGADPEARDDAHGTRPLEWARWARAVRAEGLLALVTAPNEESGS
jgi:ankyrin repeat protein